MSYLDHSQAQQQQPIGGTYPEHPVTNANGSVGAYAPDYNTPQTTGNTYPASASPHDGNQHQLGHPQAVQSPNMGPTSAPAYNSQPGTEYYSEKPSDNSHGAPIPHPSSPGPHQQGYPQQPQQSYHSGPPQQGTPLQSYGPGAPQQGQPQGGPQRTNYQTVTPLASLQGSPAPVDCPICRVREMTRTHFTSGSTTHLAALLCCCVVCLGCIPYLASWFKDCEHNCGNCGAMLAVWHRSGRTEVLAHS